MKPAVVNITIYQGSTYQQEFQWKTGTPATPVDLTGYTARMQIREKIASPDTIIELTTANGGIVISDATTGTFQIVMTATQTAAMNFKSAVYDLEFEIAGVVKRLFGGTVSLSLEVTR